MFGRDGEEYEIDFERGVTKNKLHKIGKAKHNGTKVSFWPDPEIFTETTVFDYNILAARFREMSFLNKNLKIVLKDERTPARMEARALRHSKLLAELLTS